MREEELFTELQQALQRARSERARHEVKSMGVGASGRDPPMSPTRSPNVTRAGLSSVREDEPSFEPADEKVVETSMGESTGGFFEHELRGYRLLKAAKLSQAERQHVMTLTKNSTHFHQIRQALRSLFSDGADQADDPGRPPRRQVWYSEETEWEPEEDWWSEDPSWWSEDVFWHDWSPSSWSPTSWDESGSYEDFGQENDTYTEEPEEKTAEELETESRVEEAFALATEANKTLAEARQAVARVRAARGYYDPTGQRATLAVSEVARARERPIFYRQGSWCPSGLSTSAEAGTP